MDDIELLILETLSFLEPMTKEMIILDFDSNELKNLGHFDINSLETKLNKLIKQDKVKKITKEKEIYYLKLMPKRPWWQKLFK